MEPIEKFIRDNRERFDQAEPAGGHMDRFRRKMGIPAASARRLSAGSLLRVAAILVLVLFSSLWIFEHIFRDNEPELLTLGQLSEEYRDVEFYYASLISNKYEQLEEVAIDSLSLRMLRNEMQSMDSVYLVLQKELSANPGDERVVNAIIEHYETRVRVMNYILQMLKDAKNMKNTENHANSQPYENPEI